MTPEPKLTEQGLREVICEIDTLLLSCKRLFDEADPGSGDKTIAAARIVTYIQCKRIITDRMI